jgi:hypothetical protein
MMTKYPGTCDVSLPVLLRDQHLDEARAAVDHLRDTLAMVQAALDDGQCTPEIAHQVTGHPLHAEHAIGQAAAAERMARSAVPGTRRAAGPANPDNDHPAADLLAAAQDLAAQFAALGYHAAYGGRLGVEIRRDDAAAILAILRGRAGSEVTQ